MPEDRSFARAVTLFVPAAALVCLAGLVLPLGVTAVLLVFLMIWGLVAGAAVGRWVAGRAARRPAARFDFEEQPSTYRTAPTYRFRVDDASFDSGSVRSVVLRVGPTGDFADVFFDLGSSRIHLASGPEPTMREHHRAFASAFDLPATVERSTRLRVPDRAIRVLCYVLGIGVAIGMLAAFVPLMKTAHGPLALSAAAQAPATIVIAAMLFAVVAGTVERIGARG